MGAKINNSKLIQSIIKQAKLQLSVDKVPSELAEKVIPVLNVNPDRDIQVVGAGADDAATATLMTTHAIKETFLIGLSLTVSKDIVSTSISSTINATPSQSVAKNLLRLGYEPLTAGEHVLNITFPIPIKLEKGTTIVVTNSTAVASINAHAIAYFYEVDI